MPDRRHEGRIGVVVRAAGALLITSTLAHAAPPPASQSVDEIVDLYAGHAVAEHNVIGAAVAVLRRGHPTRFFTYGYANLAGKVPVTSRTRFAIGSVTKIFTTDLFVQQLLAGSVRLSTPLSAFAAQLGPLPPTTQRVTLQELANFTSGYPSTPPLCTGGSAPPQTACLPSPRPTITTYDAQDFAAYFANPTAAAPAVLPAPYFYSDYSVGLLGLLLASDTGRPLDNTSLDRWFSRIRSGLLRPLGMTDTVLWPDSASSTLAGGYELPVLDPVLGGTSVTQVNVKSTGGIFATPPLLTVEGGGGSGAVLQAALCAPGNSGCTSGELVGVTVVDPGEGYHASPSVTFCPAPSVCNATAQALGEAIVLNGHVAAIRVMNPGAGYTVPTGGTVPVSVSGGFGGAGGRDAAGFAHVANGHIVDVTLTDTGAGYLPPLHVVATPSGPIENVVPIWAPAGSLKSSLRDMARLAEAALSPFDAIRDGVPAGIAASFFLAELPEICLAQGHLPLSGCPVGANLGGLSWALTPPDTHARYPVTVFKDGGLSGFSSFVDLMPTEGVGVVVLINNRQYLDPASSAGEPTTDAAEETPTIGLDAPHIGAQILNAVHFHMSASP